MSKFVIRRLLRLLMCGGLMTAVGLGTGCTSPAREDAAANQSTSAPSTRPAHWGPVRTVLAADEVRVPLRTIGGQAFLDVDIGSRTATFLVDTGSNVIAVLPSLADQLQLRRLGTGTWGDGAGGSQSAAVTHVLSLTAGGARFDDVDVEIGVIHLSAGAEGILGWPAFSDLLLTVDYPAHTLALRRGELPAPDGRTVLPLENDRGFLCVRAELNGKEIWLNPDTGCGFSGGLALPPGDAAALHWKSPPAQITLNNSYGISHATIGRLEGDLRVGQYVVRQPLAITDPARTVGVLGGAILHNFVVTFDFKNMRMRLERSSEQPIEVPSYFDLTFHWNGGNVTKVDAGGIAERMGIRAGDELVGINGQPPNDNGDFKWAGEPSLIVELRREGHAIRIELPAQPIVR